MSETLIIDLFMVLKFVFEMKFVVSNNTKQNDFMEKEHLLSYILDKRAVFATARRSLLLLVLELNKDSDKSEKDLNEYFGHSFNLCLLINRITALNL